MTDIRDTRDSEISLKDLILGLNNGWKYLLSKSKIILIVSLIGGIFGFTYASLKDIAFIAEMTFVLEDESSNSSGGYANIAGQLGLDLGGSGSGAGAFVGDNLLVLMKSRSMIQKALLTPVNITGKSQALIEYYIDINELRKKWSKDPIRSKIYFRPNIDASKLSLEQNRIIGEFYNSIINTNLIIDKQDKRSNIIYIQVSSKDELFSKYFTEILAEVVSDFYIETKTKKAVENLTILQHQTDSIKASFNTAIANVASFNDANPNPNLAKLVLKVPSQRKQFDVQLNQAILTQLIQNLEASKVSLRKEKPLIQIIDSPVLPLKTKQFGKIYGIVIGMILSANLAVVFFLFRRILKNAMK